MKNGQAKTKSPSSTAQKAKSASQEFLEGFFDSLPIAISAAAFGALFGATAIKAGFTVGQTLFASASIYAGASQFVFVELYGKQLPVWSILLAVFAINFRHILYSASLGRKMTEFSSVQKFFGFFLLVDPQFGAAEQRHEKEGRLARSYFFGYAAALYIFWLAATYLGAHFGGLIHDPKDYGLDMLLPIYFLILVMGFRHRSNWTSVVIASGGTSTLAYVYLGSPWHMWVGALCGIVLAAFLGGGEKPAEDEAKGGLQDELGKSDKEKQLAKENGTATQ